MCGKPQIIEIHIGIDNIIDKIQLRKSHLCFALKGLSWCCQLTENVGNILCFVFVSTFH